MFVAWIIPIGVSIVAALVVGIALGGISENWKFGLGIGILIFVLVLGIWSGLDSFTTIDSGEVGVVTRFGRVTDKILLPGLNWKSPHVEKVRKIYTRNRTYQTATDAHGSGDYNDYPTDSNTSDGQRITKATWQVTFSVQRTCAPYIVTEFGDLDTFVLTVVIPKFRAISRDEMKAFEAESLQQQASLEQLRKDTLKTMQTELSAFCLEVTTYDIRDIDFNEAYIATIEEQQIAEERIQTAAFNAEAVKETVKGQITQAEGNAEIRVIDAQANADAVIIAADAQAEAIELIGKMLSRYPDYIQLTFVETLAPNMSWGILPDTGVTPLLDLGSLDSAQ